MQRFVEYFAIVGIKEEEFKSIKEDDDLVPTVLQKIPQADWEDFNFPNDLPKFCFPEGFSEVYEYRQPIFISKILTEVDGHRCYFGILVFYELADITKKKYIPKAFVIISKYAYFSKYKDILFSIFENLGNSSILTKVGLAENIISQIIYNKHSPEPGSPEFSILMGTNQSTVYPPLSVTIPATGDSTATLLKLVGIDKLVKLFGALLLDKRIIFISLSYTHIYMCINALISLIYPINYKFVNCPVLPSDLVHYIETSNPFVIGIQSSCELSIPDLTTVLIMNLDTGLLLNENICYPLIPEPYFTQIQMLLVEIANPEISVIDEVYYENPAPSNINLDKKIRACFFYLLMKLLAGYRPCITYARIVPSPVVKFHSDLFMNRHDTNADFYVIFFQTTTFISFIKERGTNYRSTDYFDEVINEFGYRDDKTNDSTIELIHSISENFIKNEVSHVSNNTVEVLDFSFDWSRIDFENLKVGSIDSDKIIAPDSYGLITSTDFGLMNKVPIDISMFHCEMVFSISRRQNEIIQECVNLLFESKISETYKLVGTLIILVSSKACQFSFINEILEKLDDERTLLSVVQVSIIARILNAILKEEKNRNCYCASAQIVKIACNICHSLGKKLQFLYTYLQNHDIWGDPNFWENYYFIETQFTLLNVYLKRYPNSNMSPSRPSSIHNTDTITIFHPELKNSLDILDLSALILSQYSFLGAKDQNEVESTEMAFIHAQTLQIILQMSYLLVDLDNIKKYFGKNRTSVVYDVYKAEKIEKFKDFTDKFVLNVNKYVDLKSSQLMSLRELIKNIFESQFDEIVSICGSRTDCLHLEISSKFNPVFIYEDETQVLSIIGYMLYEKQQSEFDYDQIGSISLFPAHGILYITNKRVIFMGNSIEPFLSDFPVYASIPIKSIFKFKVMDNNYSDLSNTFTYSNVFQFKSKTCFGITFATDKNVPSEKVENMKKTLKASITDLTKSSLQFRKYSGSDNTRSDEFPSPLLKDENKNLKTSYNRVKINTFAKTADFVKLVNNFKTLTKKNIKTSHATQDYTSVPTIDKENRFNNSVLNEFVRMGVIQDNSKTQSVWRVTKINRKHCISFNIPEYSIVPKVLSEEFLMEVVKLFRHKRLPLCTFVSGASPDTPNFTKMFVLFRSEPPMSNILLTDSDKSFALFKPSDYFVRMLKSIICTLHDRHQKYFGQKFSFQTIFNKISNPYNLNMLSAEINFWFPSMLYIFFDRNYVRNSGIENISTVPIDSLSPYEIKKSYTAFQNAFFPSDPKEKVKNSFLKILNDSRWPNKVLKAISFATSATFLADVCMSSSLFSFTDGSELTSVLVCLSEIMIDPYYRTFVGFQKLIEKDWLEFSYNFYEKNVVDFSPFFLFFLDCVYQITVQFPWAFEFNCYYLGFIGYHNFTDKFETFMFGDETVGDGTEDTKEFLADTEEPHSMTNSVYSQSPFQDSQSPSNSVETCNLSSSIFKYIQSYTECCTVFHNMYYDRHYKAVLYPQFISCCYEVWPLFYVHNFQQYCIYSLETLHPRTYNRMHFDIKEMKDNSAQDSLNICINVNIDFSHDNFTYSYTGDGTPFVNDEISWIIYQIDHLNDQLDRPFSILKTNILDTDVTYFHNNPLDSPTRFTEFLYYRSMCHRTVEIPKNIKIEGEISQNLHNLSKSVSFCPFFCVFCSQYISNNEETYHCDKCKCFLHIECQIYSDMHCISVLKETDSQTSVLSLLSSCSLHQDESVIRGRLFTRKIFKNTWIQKYYEFNKKSHIFSIFNSSDFSGIPLYSYSASQLSSCSSLLNIPANTPKEFQKTGGLFELKIKKKNQIYLAPTKAEAVIWVEVINRFIQT